MKFIVIVAFMAVIAAGFVAAQEVGGTSPPAPTFFPLQPCAIAPDNSQYVCCNTNLSIYPCCYVSSTTNGVPKYTCGCQGLGQPC